MLANVARLGRRFAVAWVRGICGRASWVMLATVLLTAAVAAYAVGHLSIDTDTEDMLSEDLAFRQRAAEVKQAFPQLTDEIVVVIEAPTPDRADDAARRLGTALRAQPALFRDIFDPAGSDFFRRNGLLYADLDDLYALGDQLAAAQPFLGALWRDPSLRGLFGILERALDQALVGREMPGEVAPVLEAMARVLESQARGEVGQLSWQSLMTEGKPALNPPYRRIVLVQPVKDFDSLQPARRSIAAIREAASKLNLTGAEGVRVRLTGSAALAEDELESVQDGLGLAGILSVSLVLGLLAVGLRSWRLVAATLGALAVGLIWTAGFAALAIGTLNLISVAFAVLFIGLSVDFGIHFGLRYREGVDKGAASIDALAGAAEKVGGALTLCAVAAAIGFFSFLPTAYKGLAELGLIAGGGMFVALAANLTVLPAVLTLLPVTARNSSAGGGDLPVARARRALQRHARPTLWVALMLGMLAAFALPRARFDFDPLNLQDPKTESVATLRDLMAAGHDGPYSLTVLADDLDAARELSGKLAILDEVRETETLFRFVPENQDEKLDVIGTAALFLAPAFSAPRAAPPAVAETRTALAAFRQDLRAMASREATGALASAAARLDGAFARLAGDDPLPDAVLATMEDRLIDGLPARLADLRAALEPAPVGLDDLPSALRSRYVAADGRARVEVSPQADLRDPRALERFVAAVREVAPNAVGGPVVILEAGRAVVGAFRAAAILAVAGIAVLLILVLRNLRDVLMVFAPLVLAALFTVAATIVFGLAFNFANVIVLPLLFGLGVANGIHVVSRERAEADSAHVLETSTPRAVIFSALTTIGSFGSIALSSHPGTSSMGVLLTLAISLTLISTLVLLPALMAVWPRREAR